VIIPGQEITLGRDGEVFIMGKEAPKAEGEEKMEGHEEPNPDEDFNNQFAKILEHDKLMNESDDEIWSMGDGSNFEGMDLLQIAQAFNTNLGGGAYGGRLWGLASIRAHQLNEAINLEMPWKYRGMLVDQINTLQHNSGNIFANKPWPGHPSSFIGDVLDTKASEHSMIWMETERDEMGNSMLAPATQQMLRDYKVWAKREGYPSIYGSDISKLTEEELVDLKNNEKRQIAKAREKEKNKWKYGRRVWVMKRGDTLIAFHKIAGATLKVHVPTLTHSVSIKSQWKGKGVIRELADRMAGAM